MSPTSVPPTVPPPPQLPGLVRVFGNPRLCTDSEVLALAFPSEETLCSVEESGMLRIWDTATGRLRSWRFLSNRETLWQFTHDARYLASAGRELCLWDVRGGELLQVHAPPAWVTALAFRNADAPEKLILATGDEQGHLCIWARAGEQLLRTLLGHGREISTLAFSPDGARLASAGEDRVVCVWELPTGRCIGQFDAHTDRVVALAWHPRGQFLASAGWDGTVCIWDTTSGNLAGQLGEPAAPLHALAFDPAGQTLAAADATAHVQVWDWATRTPRQLYEGTSTKLTHLLFSPQGNQLAAAGEDRRIRLFPLTGACTSPSSCRLPEAFPISGFRRNWNSVALGPGGTPVAEIGEPGMVRLWDAHTCRFQLSLDPPQRFHAVAVRPDGRQVAAGGEAGQVVLWSTENGECVAVLDYDEQRGPLTSLAFSPDGAWLVGASAAGTSLCLWQLADGEPAWFYADALDGCTVEALAFSVDGHLLAAAGIDWMATGGTNGLIVVWSLPEWREEAAFEIGSAAVAFHPSRREIACARLDGTLRLWPFGDEQPRLELPGSLGIVTGLAFSPDGCLLASGGEDRFLRLWHVESGELLAQVELDTQIKTLTFSPDGRHLFIANGNTSTYQFEVERLLDGPAGAVH